MKPGGDISAADKESIQELEEMEARIDSNVFGHRDDIKAQIYTCLAHDWYSMDMDEEGHRLLEKAEKTFPGYFKNVIVRHTKENPDFARVVKNLTLKLVDLLDAGLGNK